MRLTLCEMTSTKPIESIAPTKAARISPAEEETTPRLRSRIIVIETVSFAPEEMPSTKGPAMGLWKNVCSRYPETDSAPPRIRAESSRGRRICKRIRRCAASPPPRRIDHISDAGSFTLPAKIFQIKNTSIKRKSSRKPLQVRIVRFSSMLLLLDIQVNLCRNRSPSAFSSFKIA